MTPRLPSKHPAPPSPLLARRPSHKEDKQTGSTRPTTHRHAHPIATDAIARALAHVAATEASTQPMHVQRPDTSGTQHPQQGIQHPDSPGRPQPDGAMRLCARPTRAANCTFVVSLEFCCLPISSASTRQDEHSTGCSAQPLRHNRLRARAKQADQREVGRQHGRAPDGAVDGQGARTQASSELLSTDAREAFVPSNGGSPEILLKFRLMSHASSRMLICWSDGLRVGRDVSGRVRAA